MGLDAVGGESTGILASILGSDSHLVVYAILSGKPIVISQIDLIPKRIKIYGFWMYEQQYLSKHHNAIQESAGLIAAKKMVIPVAAIYPVSAIKQAIEHTQKGEKVLLDFKQ